MEGRGRSRARKRKFFSRKRLTSFLLAAAMVCTNIGSDLSTAYAAGSSTDVSFEMRGSDLVTAIEDAIATENVVTPDDLNFTNGKVDDFEGFLFGEGKLYEAYPEMEGGDVDADMRVFVRLPEDADDMYAVTGDEEVIFLYINNSDETVRFRSLINYTKDGEDKVKKTDWVSVRSYESVYGDEEVNVIPDQPETEETAETPETTVPETEAPVDETTEETTAPAEEDPIATDSEMTVSMSPNVAALVAAPGDDDVATPSEITGGEETADEPETTAPEESNEGLVDEGNLPEESDPATTPEESQPAEETTPVEETTEVPETTVPETTAPAKDPVATEDEIQSAPKPDYSDLVGIGWSGTGKIYTSTLNKLHAMDTSIELTAEVIGADGVTVTLSARDGVLPEGSYIEAVAIDDSETLEMMMDAADKELNPEDKKATDIFAADIKLYDADGNEIQPDGSVKVSFEGTGLDADESTVFHMENSDYGIALMSADLAEENNYSAKEMVTSSDEDSITFATTHFSEYAVIETAEGTFYPVSFYYMDGGEKVIISEGQYVEEGQAAIEPEVPDRAGYIFDHWSLDFSAVKEALEVEAIYVENAGTVTLRINYVYNSEDGPTAAAPWIAEVAANSTDYIVTVPSPDLEGYEASQKSVTFSGPFTENETEYVIYSGTKVEYKVNHYLLAVNGVDKVLEATDILTGVSGSLTEAEAKEYTGFSVQEIPQITIQSDGSTVVDVIYKRNTYEISFSTGDGASYVAPQRAVYGAPIEEPADPTRLGYTFIGWDPKVPETMPASNTQLKAQWMENTTAPYQVIYWLESVDGNGYDYVTSIDGSGNVDDEIKGQALSSGEWQNANIDPNGVERDTSRDETVTIKADGSAVKNVYYSRKTFSIFFYVASKYDWFGNGSDWEKKDNLTITEKYGADISEEWESRAEDYEWNTKPNGNTSYTLFANMPAENTTMYAAEKGRGTTITYYIEGLNGGREEYTQFEAASGVSLTEEDKQPIEGFTFSEWKKNAGWSSDLWLYYTRNSYTISFENCTDIDDASLKYEQTLSVAKPADNMIGRPEGVYADSTFGGWYYSPACEEGTEVNWNSDTMPSHNIQVYAKWIDPEYTVTFHTNGGNDIDSRTYSVGDVVENLPTPKKEGDTFVGWYTDAEFTYEFVENTNIYENIDLYAKWESDNYVSYTVKHVDKETGGEIPGTSGETGTAKLGETVEIHAKNDLPGYYANITSMTVLVNEPNQEFVIEYTPIETWTYTVKYLLEGSEDPVPGFPEEVSDPTDAQEVVVSYKPIDGYTLVGDPTVTVKKSDENKTVTFYYKKSTTLYHVQHLIEKLDSDDPSDPNNYSVYDVTTVNNVETGIQVRGEAISIEGFTYDQTMKPEEATGHTNAEQILMLKLYYKRNSHSVTYQYEGTVPEGATDLPGMTTYKYGAEVKVASDATAPGYVFSGWKTEDVTVTENGFSMPDGDVVFVGSFTANDQTLRVNYVMDDEASTVIHEAYTDDAKYDDEYDLSKQILGTVEYEGQTYELISKSGSAVSGTVKGDVEITLVYSLDADEDTTPDKYEATVTYEVVNGTFAEGETTVTQEYVLAEENEEDGTWTEATRYLENIPVPTANEGYGNGGWDVTPTTETVVEDGAKYTYTYTANDQTLRVNYVMDDEASTVIHEAYTDDAKYDDEYDLSKQILGTVEYEGQTYELISKSGSAVSGTVKGDVEITLVYSLDADEDTTPDKYEATVTYEVVNGTFAEGETTVTQEYVLAEENEEDGTWTEATRYLENIPVPTANEGYGNGGWDVTPTTETVVEDGAKYTYTYTANDQTLRVNYVMDDEASTVIHEAYTDDAKYDDEYDLSKQILGTVEYEGQTYELISKSGSAVSGTVKGDVEITLVYSLDADEDTTPDKYEATVTYEVVNGTFAEGETTVTQEYVLAEENEEDGTWTEATRYLENIPVPTANEGYGNGGWDVTPTTETVVEDGAKYTYTYTANDQTLRVNYVMDDEASTVIHEAYTDDAKYDDEYDLSKQILGTVEYEGQTYELISKSGSAVSGTVKGDVEITLVYSLDADEDTTPDKYEATVTYEVVNGTFAEGETTVTQEYVLAEENEEDGTWTEATRYLENIPVPTANEGYGNGGWDVTPTTETVVEDGAKYTYTYTANDQTLRVNYVMDDEASTVIHEAYTDDAKYDDEYDLSKQILGTVEYEGQTYELISKSGSAVSGTVKGDVEITLVYSLDADEDTTPDKYEATVTYEVVNGTFAEGETTVTQEYVLAEENEEDGTWTEATRYLENIPVPTANEGYGNGGWDVTPTTETVVEDGAKYTYTYTANDQTLRVNYVMDDEASTVIHEAYTDDAKYDDEYDLSKQILGTVEYEGQTYELISKSGSAVSGTVKGDVEITLVYSLDADEDTTPDKYEVTITYKAEHGTFAGENDTRVTETSKDYVIAEQNDDGTWTPIDTVIGEGNIPDATADTGYDQNNFEWSPIRPTEDTQVIVDFTFTITFEKDNFGYIIMQHLVNEDGQEVKTATVQYGDLAFETNILEGSNYQRPDTVEYENQNYVFYMIEGEDKTIGTSADENIVDIYYGLDVKGEGEDPNQPDNVPDMYQTTITFIAVNGNFSGETEVNRVVTLYGADGKWSEDGTYAVSGENDVPYVEPNEGYRGGIWEPSPFNAVVSKDSNRTFTITFQPDDAEARVEFYFDGELDESVTETSKETYGSTFVIAPEQSLDHNEHHYVLESVENNGVVIGTDPDQNVIRVYYALDEIGEGEDPNTPDDTPDKYQMFVTFAAVNGTFDENDTTQAERVVTFKDEVGTPSEMGTYTFTEDRVPASSPITGYVEPGTWDRDPLTTVLSMDSDNLTFTIAYYTRDRYEAKVEFYFDGVRDDSVTQTSEEEYGLPFVVAPEQSLDHNDHHYVLEGTENNGVVIGTDPEQNVVKVYYVLDEKGGTDPENPDNPGPDDVPDKYQIVFTYVSADENTGTVTGTTREVYTFKDAAGNYVENTGISPNAIEGHDPVASPAENYAFHYWTVQGQEERDYTVGMTFLGQKVYTTDTTFVAHFAEDKINDTTDGEDPNVPEDPNQPDGIPDIYQIVFTYVTEDATHGTVSGVVTEVRTFPRNGETGEYDTTAAISPNVGVTITAIGRYRFDNWTNGAGTVYDTDDLLRAAGFTEDQTFTAHFYRLSGGGSSGGGGGTSTPGGPYNPGAGPGVTITEPEVPLAPLPTEDGGSTVIFDDNVPLAPLPKTGQQSLKTPITMLLAGIFLAFASLTKRKEEN